MVLNLILIVFGVFMLFWLGDLYITLKTVKHFGRSIEINPILRFFLIGRGKLIYIFKPIELAAFLYLIWYLANFGGKVPINILLISIFIYSIIVANNAHVYYKITKKESTAFKVIFMGLTLATLLFIYLNYSLYLDLGTSYAALSKSNNQYNELYSQCSEANITITTPEPKNIKTEIPEINLPIRRGDLE